MARRLFDEFADRRTRYVLGLAAYYTALLPDDHPYYHNLGNSKVMPIQGATPAEEKSRLLALAVDRLSRLANHRDLNPEVRRRCQGLAGRAMLAAGDPRPGSQNARSSTPGE